MNQGGRNFKIFEKSTFSSMLIGPLFDCGLFASNRYY
jgi:hypothetical protein